MVEETWPASGTTGSRVALGDGGGFVAPAFRLADFGYNQGWRVGEHQRFVADLTGNGCADLIGLGDAGVWVARNDGDGGFGPPQLVFADFPFQHGATVDHPRFLTDLTGDGRPDLVSFSSAGVWVSLNDGNGGFGPSFEGVHAFGVFQGWDASSHVRLVADLSGDGRADLVAFGDQGVLVARGRGDGTFDHPEPLVSFFGLRGMPDLEWHVGRNPRLLADLTGNGAADIVGFGDDGIRVMVLDTSGPKTPQFVVPELGYLAGGDPSAPGRRPHRRRPNGPCRIRRRGCLRLSQPGHWPETPADRHPLSLAMAHR
jgi:hypothetical protein